MSERPERRRHSRIPVDAEARLRAAGREGPGTPCRLADAGRGGVSVRVDEMPAGDRILVEILDLEGEPVSEPLEARVVHVDRDPAGGYRVGCRFEIYGAGAEPED